MNLTVFPRKTPLLLCLCAIVLLFLFTACGGSTNPSSTATGSSNASTPTATATTAVTPTQPAPTVNAATATVQAMEQLMPLVGQPTAKILTGTTFAVTGQIKNGDTHQHDITLKAQLLDATGKVIATGTQLLDNIAAGKTVSYNIQGTTPQPTWSSVQVTIMNISENVNGSGGD